MKRFQIFIVQETPIFKKTLVDDVIVNGELEAMEQALEWKKDFELMSLGKTYTAMIVPVKEVDKV